MRTNDAARELEQLIRDAQVMLSGTTRGGRATDKLNVTLRDPWRNQRTISAIAVEDISPGKENCLVIITQDSKAYALSSQPKGVVTSRESISRYRPEEEPDLREDAIAVLFRKISGSGIKVLFTVVNGTNQEFWVGGDIPEPRKICQIPYEGFFRRGYLNNTGVGETDFIFSVATATQIYSIFNGEIVQTTLLGGSAIDGDLRQFGKYLGNGLWVGSWPSLPFVNADEYDYNGDDGSDTGGSGSGEYREETTYPIEIPSADFLNQFSGSCVLVTESVFGENVTTTTETTTILGSGTNTIFSFKKNWNYFTGTASYSWNKYSRGDSFSGKLEDTTDWDYLNSVALLLENTSLQTSWQSTGNVRIAPDIMAVEEKQTTAIFPEIISYSENNLLYLKNEVIGITQNLTEQEASAETGGIDGEGYYTETIPGGTSAYWAKFKARHRREIFLNQTKLDDDLVFISYLVTTNTSTVIDGSQLSVEFDFTFKFDRYGTFSDVLSDFYQNTFAHGSSAFYQVENLLNKSYRLVVRNPSWNGASKSGRYWEYSASFVQLLSITTNPSDPSYNPANPVYTVSLKVSATRLGLIGFNSKIKSHSIIGSSLYGVIYSLDENIGQLLWSAWSFTRLFDYGTGNNGSDMYANLYLKTNIETFASPSLTDEVRWRNTEESAKNTERRVTPGWTYSIFFSIFTESLKVSNLNQLGDIFFVSEVDEAIKSQGKQLFVEAWQIQGSKLVPGGLRVVDCFSLGSTSTSFRIESISYFEVPAEYRLGGVKSPIDLIRALVEFAIISNNGKNFIVTYKSGESSGSYAKVTIQQGSQRLKSTLEFVSPAEIASVKDWRKSLTQSYLIDPPDDADICINQYRDNPFASLRNRQIWLIDKYEQLGESILRSLTLANPAIAGATELVFSTAVGEGVSSDFALRINRSEEAPVIIGITKPSASGATTLEVSPLPVAVEAGLTCDILIDTLARKIKTQDTKATIQKLRLTTLEASCQTVSVGKVKLKIKSLKLTVEEIEQWEIIGAVVLASS